MKILVRIILMLLVTVFLNGHAIAGCTIDSGPIYFGNIENPVTTYPQTNGSIKVNCTSGLVYTVEINEGMHYAPVTRNLGTGAGDLLSYELKQANGTTWGDGQTAGSVLQGTGTGSAQNLTVNGQIITTGNFPVGSYSDTLIVTVKWDGGSAPWPSRTVPVTGVVEGSCTVSAAAVNFGQIRLPVTSLPQAMGGVTVNCTSLLMYRIELDEGNNYLHPMRRMKWEKGLAYLGYALYKDTGCMQYWDINSAGAETGTGTGTDQSHVICGRAWPMGNEPIGFYRDDVIARISW